MIAILVSSSKLLVLLISGVDMITLGVHTIKTELKNDDIAGSYVMYCIIAICFLFTIKDVCLLFGLTKNTPIFLLICLLVAGIGKVSFAMNVDFSMKCSVTTLFSRIQK